jgi:hypothetical protein
MSLRGRPKSLPGQAIPVTVHLIPEEQQHTERCIAYRVHDKARAATLRDLLKSARLCFPILAKLIVLSRKARHIIEASSVEAMALPSIVEPLEEVASDAGSSGAGAGEPYLAALGREDTADVLRVLDEMGSTLEDIFRLTVVGVGGDPRQDDGTDAELSDPVVRRKEQIAFDKAFRDALEEAISGDLYNHHEKS